MRVVMVGATGGNAGFVLPELIKRGVTVRALVRDERRAGLALRLGAADTVIADLADPDSLRPAVAGMDGVFHPTRYALVLSAILNREPRSLQQYIHELATHQT